MRVELPMNHATRTSWRMVPLLVGCLTAAPALCQVPPAVGPAPAPSVRHHPRHHRLHRTPVKLQPPLPPPVDPNAPQPAPVPNPDIGPPEHNLPPGQASLDPGNLQLHYPQVGDGFLPNSNAEHFDNERAPVIPGMSVTVPLAQTPPPPADDQPPP